MKWYNIIDRVNPGDSLMTYGKLYGKTHDDRHVNPEFTYIEKGKGIFCVDGVDYFFESGDVFLVFRGESHYIKETDENTSFCNLNFDIRFIYDYDFSFGLKYLRPLIVGDNKQNIKYSPDDVDAKTLKYEFSTIENEFKNKREGYDTAIRLHLMTVLLLVFRAFGLRHGTETSNNTKDILKAMDYIAGHYTEKITLSDIADEVHLSPSYFGYIFKKITGVTPWDYVNSKRVLNAIALFNEGKTGILDIALSCGFNNLTNFNNIFKKVTGYTPGVYIREGLHDIYK